MVGAKNSSQPPRLGSVRVKCRKLDSERRNEKDTASPCSFASFGVSFKVILHTYSDASEEVFICSATAPTSEEGTGCGAASTHAKRGASYRQGGVGEKAEEMSEQNFDATKMIEAIKECLRNVAKKLNEEHRTLNSDWTKMCLGELAALGESKFKYQAAPCPRCGEHGWLYDLIWWKGEKGEMTDLILVLESEWSPSIRFVRYDFQKLVQARARIKVLISDALSLEDRETLMSDIKNFKQNENDGEYLFAMYNGNKANPNEFAFFTRDTLASNPC